jgi:hypothetical protein
MKKIICLLFVFFIISVGLAYDKAKAYLVIDNHTEWTLDVYIDNKYGCTALPYNHCITDVSLGFHIFSTSNGETSVSESAVFKEGTIFKWTVRPIEEEEVIQI